MRARDTFVHRWKADRQIDSYGETISRKSSVKDDTKNKDSKSTGNTKEENQRGANYRKKAGKLKALK
ncbi:hypothetical protein CesoFtcFv8_026100 [Champsocephalus esox]|uniref:Uncharacterized protein n=1 Tax=Champsocephalus esox TaxID=159716 RepID=A0AAN8B2M4_9TELE|nr:hypothetical protein CesoFtcFv8_026100 [Champsocephalus esox]